MTYKQLKWFILLIPTFTVGIWEYVRHEYVRMGIENLCSPAQENVDFMKQIQLHINRFETETGIKAANSIEVNEVLLSESQKSALPAFIGEALTNIRKHAEATKVTLNLQITTKNRCLLIEDNGIGIDINETLQESHYGLKMLHERCERIGWHLQITRDLGWTRLTFSPKEAVL